MPQLRRYSPTKSWMVPRCRFLATFLGPAFAASRVQRLSDLHSKFALGPHHRSMVEIQSVAAEIRRGKKDRRYTIQITGQKYNGPLLHRAAIISGALRQQGLLIISLKSYFYVFGRLFVKRFALCYQTVVCLSCLSVTYVGVLWPNGSMTQE